MLNSQFRPEGLGVKIAERSDKQFSWQQELSGWSSCSAFSYLISKINFSFSCNKSIIFYFHILDLSITDTWNTTKAESFDKFYSFLFFFNTFPDTFTKIKFIANNITTVVFILLWFILLVWIIIISRLNPDSLPKKHQNLSTKYHYKFMILIDSIYEI